jgi:ABC-2 type transport system ATP-binding protein
MISVPQATIVERTGPRVKLTFDPDVISASELIARITADHEVRDLFVENPTIEEIVARMYAENRL